MASGEPPITRSFNMWEKEVTKQFTQLQRQTEEENRRVIGRQEQAAERHPMAGGSVTSGELLEFKTWGCVQVARSAFRLPLKT